MSSTTLLPIGTLIYYTGISPEEGNHVPDWGWVIEHKTGFTCCTARKTNVTETYYVIRWSSDAQVFHNTHHELDNDTFIILEDT